MLYTFLNEITFAFGKIYLKLQKNVSLTTTATRAESAVSIDAATDGEIMVGTWRAEENLEKSAITFHIAGNNSNVWVSILVIA